MPTRWKLGQVCKQPDYRFKYRTKISPWNSPKLAQLEWCKCRGDRTRCQNQLGRSTVLSICVGRKFRAEILTRTILLGSRGSQVSTGKNMETVLKASPHILRWIGKSTFKGRDTRTCHSKWTKVKYSIYIVKWLSRYWCGSCIW